MKNSVKIYKCVGYNYKNTANAKLFGETLDIYSSGFDYIRALKVRSELDK